jgi:periplasmic divalent cation tolerance protein
MENKYCMVLATCPNRVVARDIAQALIERKLAACVQMHNIESIYIWNGELHDEPEIMLTIKTRTNLFEQIQETIVENHPFEVPGITQFPVTRGLPSFLEWVDTHTKNE